MVRPAMQEENRCLVEGNVAAIYPASLRGIISEVDPRALMEFAYLAVLNQYISLSLSWLLSPSGFQRGGRAFHAITVDFTLRNSWCGTRLMPDQGGLIGMVRGRYGVTR
ncbi:hypothetical protein Thi970DRAFT_00250 [Thiorhodovibrio frisius]|uniref:Uncharacterized protein n=1 Tax=Thiorhodovibrio frisius TaxID=631362 RepID=H8YVV4_9GAMM|nr:hypothetical protein Thi970DRAFT_00250 [Thiorhodovibrio frisius]WPL20151.1 hypothetical protein Thiofri_00213 [Thiorhodovibrio frisius]